MGKLILRMDSMKLLTYSSSKIEKSNNAGLGYLTAIMYLAPHNLSGHIVCPDATEGCIWACLNTAGRGQMNTVQQARINRTNFLFTNRPSFKAQLDTETKAHIRKARRMHLQPAVRYNGTSDIAWEYIVRMMRDYPDVTFYDYTKSLKRMDSNLPCNYSLTFSRSEKTRDVDITNLLRNGHNVAVVFHKVIPASYLGFPVIDGDAHDMRFLDPKGVIVGLKAKGKAKKDASGFVV